MRGFVSFDISVLGAGGHVWVSAQSRQGSVFGVSRRRPVWNLPDDADRPVDWLTRVVGGAHQVDDVALLVGSSLNEVVFGEPDIAMLFNQTRGVAAAIGSQLLVRVLAAPYEVGSWPWELMVDPQQSGRFLTMAPDVHLVRSGRRRTYPVRETVIKPPLNLLLVLSSPLRSGPQDVEAPFDLYAEKRSLLAELRPLEDRGLLRVVVEDRPTIERLRTRMAGERRGFHVVHYLGHAQPAGLQLEGPHGRSRLVGGEQFAGLLQQMSDLRLAVFAGCETARAVEEQYSMADCCVRDACPMVIGMQAVLPFGTERIFTRFFYQALTGGQSVAEALRLARLAIADDEFAGQRLLNWAVPCLFVGGVEPVPLTDPEAKAVAPAPRRELGLTLDIRQRELRFIARLTELREAIDVLSGRASARVLVVIGSQGTGKTGLLDRALEELDDDIAHLFISVKRLLAAADPVHELASAVAERITVSGRHATKRGRLSSHEWWERLLADLTDVPLALAVDDADLLRRDDPHAKALTSALRSIGRRRSKARLAIVAKKEIGALTAGLSARELRTIRLNALSWIEVWQWIRRNLPTLTRYESHELSGFYAMLPQLEHWEQLAEHVASTAVPASDLSPLVDAVSKSLGGPTTTGTPPALFGEPPTVNTLPVPVRSVLRVAIVGPHTSGREPQFAAGVTQLAAERGVAGRMAGAETPDLTSSLAELLTLESPFVDGIANDGDVLKWLSSAISADADVILLDFGTERPSAVWKRVIDRVISQGRLVISAGAIGGKQSYPAGYEGVLAVGALENDVPAPYSRYFAKKDKPELFAPETVESTPLASIPNDPERRGTSFAALNVVGDAILVWATDEDLSAQDVQRILIDTADHLPTPDGQIRRINVDAALKEVRARRILDALERGPLELNELLAETGIVAEHAQPILSTLVDKAQLRKVVRDGIERFENPDALYLSYAQQLDPGASAELVDHARGLARRRPLAVEDIQELWQRGGSARRLVALGILQARPELDAANIVRDAIAEPATEFEQLHALIAAQAMLEKIDEEGKALLRDAISAASQPKRAPALAGERKQLAERLLASLVTTPPDRRSRGNSGRVERPRA